MPHNKMVRVLNCAILQLGILLATPMSVYCEGNSVEQWIHQLQSKDALTRDKAAYDLHLPTPTSEEISRLIQILKNDHASFAREHVAAALGELPPGDGRIIEALVEACSDRDSSVRAQAAIALSKIGDSAIPFVIKRLAELGAERLSNTDRYGRALSFVLEESKSNVVDQFLAKIKDRSQRANASKRSKALNAALQPFKSFADDFEAYAACFCANAGISTVPSLVPLIESPKTRDFALNTLKLIAGYEPLSRKWDSNDPDEQSIARSVIRRSTGDTQQFISQLIANLGHTSAKGRLLALEAMVASKEEGDWEGVQVDWIGIQSYLIELLESEDITTRDTTADLLEQSNVSSALSPAVLERMNTLRPVSKKDEIWANDVQLEDDLAGNPSDEKISKVVARLQKPVPFPERLISVAVELAPNHPSISQPLYDLLVDPTVSPMHASMVAEAITGSINLLKPPLLVCAALVDYYPGWSGQIAAGFIASSGEHGIEILLQLARQKDINVAQRVAACLAIGKTDPSNPAVIETLRALCNDANPEVRSAAAAGLALAGEPKEGVALLKKKIGHGMFKLSKDLGPSVDLQLLDAVVSKCPEVALGWLRSSLSNEETWCLLAAIQKSDIRSEDFVAPILSLTTHFDDTVSKEAFECLKNFTRFDKIIFAGLIKKLQGDKPFPQEFVRRSLGLLSALSGRSDDIDPTFFRALLDYRVTSMFDPLEYRLVERVYDTEVLHGGGTTPIERAPAFPWPPPVSSSVAISGKDFDRRLLGDDNSTFGDVAARLHNALIKCDENFQTELFPLPDGKKGFVMLCRKECINEDGTPLMGYNRFCDDEERVPSTSYLDILTGFFFSKPGFFRTVAFAITDEANFGSDEKRSLPPFNKNMEATLPQDVAQTLFKGMNCYAFIYEFQKPPGQCKGEKLFHGAQSAEVHLQRLGLLTALSKSK